MIYISAQPDSEYFIWQLEVLDSNMRELGIIDNSIVLLGFTNPPTKAALEYQSKNKNRVFLINDTRNEFEKEYIPSIRPHILSKFFQKAEKLFKDKPVFYHDSDILFTDQINIETKKNHVYVSDTISYIGSKYILSKSDELFLKMCEIVGIDPEIVKKNENNSGGAQYLFPPNFLTHEYWNKVFFDSVKLYELMINTAGEYTPSGGTPIQAWTADMWCVLWNIWLFGGKSKIHKELKFSWPTYNIKEWENYKIYHNSGVTEKMEDLFFKGRYTNKTPFNDDLSYVNKNKCSFKYVEQINKCKMYL